MKKHSKKTSILATLFIIYLIAPFISADEGRNYCHLKYLEGSVLMQRANEADVSEAVRNMPVMAGDRLWTEEGRVQVQMYDGSIINLNTNTKIDFEAIGEAVDSDTYYTVIKLWSGQVILNMLIDRNRNDVLRLETASGYISFLNRGRYRVDVDDNFSVNVTAIEGLAEVGDGENTTMLRSGQRLYIDSIEGISEQIAFSETDDEFMMWIDSHSRSYETTRHVSNQYVDDQLDYLVDDMDDYGEWRYHDTYETYVWIPYTRYIYSGWRPYYHGNWIWTPHGWSFVSYDPWGWTPYRYGRWDWSPWGWCWIPGYRYSPSWVYWEIGYDYIAWSPIGYYNYPPNRYWWKEYPRGYKPRGGTGSYDLTGDSWVVMSKKKFGANPVNTNTLTKDVIQKLDRKGAKTISPVISEKGFSDRKASPRDSSSIAATTYKDIPNGYKIPDKGYSYKFKGKSSIGSSVGSSTEKKSTSDSLTSQYRKKYSSSGSYYKTEYRKNISSTTKGSSSKSTTIKSKTNSKSSPDTISNKTKKSTPDKKSSDSSAKSKSSGSNSSSSSISKSTSGSSSSTKNRNSISSYTKYSYKTGTNAYRSTGRYAISSYTANKYKSSNKPTSSSITSRYKKPSSSSIYSKYGSTYKRSSPSHSKSISSVSRGYKSSSSASISRSIPKSSSYTRSSSKSHSISSASRPSRSSSSSSKSSVSRSSSSSSSSSAKRK